MRRYDVLFVGSHKAFSKGGAERSVSAIIRRMVARGYDVGWTTIKSLGEVREPPEAFVVQSVVAATFRRLAGEFFSGVSAIQYIQDVRYADTVWDAWTRVLCNSHYTRRWAIERGCPEGKTAVQFPVLEPAALRVERVRGEYVLSMDVSEGKGGGIFRALARELPEEYFMGVSRGGGMEVTDNLTIRPPVDVPAGLYVSAKAVICPTQVEEAFGRVPLEAVGNGIPVVVSDAGNLPWFAERFPDMVEVVPRDAPIGEWVAALGRALKRERVRHDEVWEWGVDNTIDMLMEMGVEGMGADREPPIAVHQNAGVGDILMALPAVRELARRREVYAAPRMRGYLREMLEMCPYVTQGEPPPGTQEQLLRHHDHEPETVHMPRYEYIARHVGVTLTDTRPVITLDARRLRQIRTALNRLSGGRKRPWLGLALNAGTIHRSMAKANQRRVSDALAVDYEVFVVHHTPTLGDSPHIHDLGGQLEFQEWVHALAVMDVMVAVDSGSAHLAATVQTPLVVMMGAVGCGGHIRFVEQYGGRIVELCKGLECQPCWNNATYGCDGEPPCLAFEPEEVLPAVKEMTCSKS